MTHTHIFAFNPFQTNTYLFWDDSNEAVVIDAAMYTEEENQTFKDFISENNLKLVANITTHAHLDHIMGNHFIKQEYGLSPIMDKKGQQFLDTASEYASSFGLKLENIALTNQFVEEGDSIIFGDCEFKIISTPGHADGSICLFSEKENLVVVGDVLFNRGIGRTDLPSGDFNLLIESIKTKLFVLADDVVVYPGHGPKTTIGEEKQANPYVD